MSAEAPMRAGTNAGGDSYSRDPSSAQDRHRRRRRDGPILAVAAAVTAAIAAVSGVAHVATDSAWEAEYAKIADEVAPGYELVDRSAAGNVMCLDVCREVTSLYLTDESTEVAIETVAERMRGAGFTDVGYDCKANLWCSAWGDAGEVAVYVSKYKDASWAAKEPGLADQLTVTVSMPE